MFFSSHGISFCLFFQSRQRQPLKYLLLELKLVCCQLPKVNHCILVSNLRVLKKIQTVQKTSLLFIDFSFTGPSHCCQSDMCASLHVWWWWWQGRVYFIYMNERYIPVHVEARGGQWIFSSIAFFILLRQCFIELEACLLARLVSFQGPSVSISQGREVQCMQPCLMFSQDFQDSDLGPHAYTCFSH